MDRAYRLLDRGLADAEQSFHTHGAVNRANAQAMRRALEILRNSRGSGQLIFGRIDDADDTLYIGRRRVYDENRDLAVISWHSPAAQIFYEAGPDDPKGLRLKRVFVEEDRRLRRVVDEIVASSAAQAVAVDADGLSLTVSDALLAELDRSRDGAMREVVATIQAEQHRIIRADRPGVLVVQGGPGTGKTVVGLHRAAWLAFNHADLRREGMLVVVPSTAFLSYVGGVLPSLDASDVQQADLGSVYAGEARAVAGETPVAARVKGSAEMAVVLRRALDFRIGWSGGDFDFSLGADRVRVPAAEIDELVADIRGRDLSHSTARDVLRQALSALAFRHYAESQRESHRPIVATEPLIRRLSAFGNALDQMWPTFTPEELLRSLYGTQAWLTQAADGILPADDRAELFRPPAPGVADEPWTAADLFCLDELSYLLNRDTISYGHIVVDEAQDLSPMQARALGRRCPSGSFTVLGDLAQATGAWIRDSWVELTGHLSTGPTRVETLTIGYRVPASVLELAARQLPLVSPSLAAPRSVRVGRGVPASLPTTAESLLDVALATGSDAVAAGLTTALVVPEARYDEALSFCRARVADVGDGRDGDFAASITVVPARSTKGLEFDSVVLVAPDEIVSAAPDGRRALYVAMTRCTQELKLVCAGPLPLGLDHLSDGGSRPAAPAPEPAGLEFLLTRLRTEDRNLVELLVRRLVDGDEPDTRRDHP